MSRFGADWVRRAACDGEPAQVFFPEFVGNRADAYAAARPICARCPVSSECLEYALDAHEKFGMWGGLNPHERKNLQARRNRGEVA